jgi:hypothetical protein
MSEKEKETTEKETKNSLDMVIESISGDVINYIKKNVITVFKAVAEEISEIIDEKTKKWKKNK